MLDSKHSKGPPGPDEETSKQAGTNGLQVEAQPFISDILTTTDNAIKLSTWYSARIQHKSSRHNNLFAKPYDLIN